MPARSEAEYEREGRVEVAQLARAEAADGLPEPLGLTAVVCSTSTRVGEPSRSMVGRNDLGGAAVDVGETSTVESASSSSA